MNFRNFFIQHWPFLAILLLALFTRTYKLTSLYGYGHEQDLQNWIVKDILIDLHPRLIGQETSITGLFIGPAYYYILVPFFFLLGMNPLASYIPITFISLITLISIYYVINKLYGKVPATVAAFIYAISPAIVFLDRWVVPTQPTLLWIIWFFFVLINYLKGNLRVTPILIVLLGFIWHIHVAFVPLLLLLPVALYLSKANIKKQFATVNKKYLVASIAAFLFLITPFVAFELRHNFQQVRGLRNVGEVVEGEGRELREGYYKVEVITELINRTIWSPLLFEYNPKDPMIFKIPVMLFVFLGLVYFVYKRSQLKKEELILIYLWIFDVGISHFFSERLISEYYFNNLMILSLIVLSLTLSYFYRQKFSKMAVFALGVVFFIVSINSIISKKVPVGEYKDKSAVVEYIASDVQENNYPCVGINFIGDIPVRYGYRYLFWYNDVMQVMPGNEVPVYSIVRPATISEDEVEFTSGDIGVILPVEPSIPKSDFCSSPANQLESLNGFVK